MQVTFAETHVTLPSYTKGVVKEELTKDDSIVPRSEILLSIRSNSKENKKSTREIESAGTNLVSQELTNQ